MSRDKPKTISHGTNSVLSNLSLPLPPFPYPPPITHKETHTHTLVKQTHRPPCVKAQRLKLRTVSLWDRCVIMGSVKVSLVKLCLFLPAFACVCLSLLVYVSKPACVTCVYVSVSVCELVGCVISCVLCSL